MNYGAVYIHADPAIHLLCTLDSAVLIAFCTINMSQYGKTH